MFCCIVLCVFFAIVLYGCLLLCFVHRFCFKCFVLRFCLMVFVVSLNVRFVLYSFVSCFCCLFLCMVLFINVPFCSCCLEVFWVVFKGLFVFCLICNCFVLRACVRFVHDFNCCFLFSIVFACLCNMFSEFVLFSFLEGVAAVYLLFLFKFNSLLDLYCFYLLGL